MKPHSSSSELVKNYILGVGITNESVEIILEYIIQKLEKSSENFFIVTPNPEIIVLSEKRIEFKKILNEANIALCDGIGILLASKILGKPLIYRITGVDFMKTICKEVSKRPITVGFLGGRQSVAEEVSNCLKMEFPSLNVVFAQEEWDEIDMQSKKNFKIDILFVAFGFPKQEVWMSEHINKVPVRVMMGVGGSFDYLSGRIKRAPLFLRMFGFEWLYRLLKQPWRFKRQLALIKFIFIIIKEKYRLRKNT